MAGLMEAFEGDCPRCRCDHMKHDRKHLTDEARQTLRGQKVLEFFCPECGCPGYIEDELGCAGIGDHFVSIHAVEAKWLEAKRPA